MSIDAVNDHSRNSRCGGKSRHRIKGLPKDPWTKGRLGSQWLTPGPPLFLWWLVDTEWVGGKEIVNEVLKARIDSEKRMPKAMWIARVGRSHPSAVHLPTKSFTRLSSCDPINPALSQYTLQWMGQWEWYNTYIQVQAFISFIPHHRHRVIHDKKRSPIFKISLYHNKLEVGVL